MNLFFLDQWLDTNARVMCDKHVVKMILETCQILYTCWHLRTDMPQSKLTPYKMSHKNHPMALWVRACRENYEYACYYGLLLCVEYTARYEKVHKTEQHLRQLLQWGYPPLTKVIEPPKKAKAVEFAFEDIPFGLSCVPLCMDEEYYVRKDGILQGVESYRNYYRSKRDKFKMAWKQNRPEWF